MRTNTLPVFVTVGACITVLLASAPASADLLHGRLLFETAPSLIAQASVDEDVLGAPIGDLDISGDGLPDVVEVIKPRIDFDDVDLSTLTCTCDLPWILGSIMIADAATGQLHATIHATHIADALGRSVSATNDFNLDGAIDLLVGAPGKDVYGRGYVFYGPFSGDVVLSLDDADVVLAPAHVVDHEYGHMIASLPDLTGDGIPEVRIRSARGALVEQRFITHVHDGATGEHLAAIRAPIVEDMWQPIEGDLDDDGDVDESDQFRLLAQLGRVADEHRIWADVDIEGAVTAEDFVDQYIALGEHPGLGISRDAVATMAAANGPSDCSCPPSVPPDCCVINQDGEIECCDEDEPHVLDCIKELPDQIPSAAIADCEADPACAACFDDWYDWLQNLMSEGNGPNCIWPTVQGSTIHFVNCDDCDGIVQDGRRPVGLHSDGEIWICIDYFLNDDGGIDPEECVQLKRTMLEELMHAVQLCYLPTLPQEEQDDACLRWGCNEIQAGRLVDCMGDANPCTCGLSEAVVTIAWRAAAEPDPEAKREWQECMLRWMQIQSRFTGEEEGLCEFLAGECSDNGLDMSERPPCELGTPSDPIPPPEALAVSGRSR